MEVGVIRRRRSAVGVAHDLLVDHVEREERIEIDAQALLVRESLALRQEVELVLVELAAILDGERVDVFDAGFPPGFPEKARARFREKIRLPALDADGSSVGGEEKADVSVGIDVVDDDVRRARGGERNADVLSRGVYGSALTRELDGDGEAAVGSRRGRSGAFL